MLKNATWLFILSILVLFMFLPSYTKVQDLSKKNREYKKQITVLAQENVRLSAEKTLLEEDPEYLEKVGREKMGLIKEGEVVCRFVEKAEE